MRQARRMQCRIIGRFQGFGSMLKALDPGKRHLGWASWEAVENTPQSGVHDLRAEIEGATYSRARKLMRAFIRPGDMIALEAPLLPPGASIQSRLAMFGIRACILMAAFEARADVREVQVQEWRSWALGLCWAPATVKGSEARRRWLKARAKAEVKARGWGDVGDDEAEAILMVDWLRAQEDHAYGLRTRPALPLPVVRA
jgi:hypothetical protein